MTRPFSLGQENEGGDAKMVKIRIQGTSNELKRCRRVLERENRIDILNQSDVFPNKGTSKYYRQYMDIQIRQKTKR